MSEMQIGVELRHAAATGSPPLAVALKHITNYPGSLNTPFPMSGSQTAPAPPDPRPSADPFIPPNQVFKPRQKKHYEPGSVDDPATWADINAYEIASTGVR